MRAAAIAMLSIVMIVCATSSAQPTAPPLPFGQPTPPTPSPATSPAPSLAALGPHDDARKSIAIGANGEVYEPDGNGAWIRTQRITTASSISAAGRAGDIVLAFGEGVVYRLAPNGWSAIRLHQKERAIMSSGSGVVAAVGRQVFALDKTASGEPAKRVVAPAAIIAIASGAGAGTTSTGAAGGAAGAAASPAIVQTNAGLFRVEGARLVAVKNAPRPIEKLVSDRWVLVGDGAIDLRTGRKTGWPPGTSIAAASAIVGAPERLALVASRGGGAPLELVTISGGATERAPLEVAPLGAVAVAVVVDKNGAVVIALRDGQLLVRDKNGGTWTTTRVRDELPAPKPGAPPAKSR